VEAECTFTRFEQAAAKHAQRTALIFLGDRITYRRLHDLVQRFAGGLASLGIGKGDRVVLYLNNTPQFVIAFLAIQRLGAAAVLISPVYTSHEIQYIVKDAGAQTIICHDTNYGYVREIMSETPLKHIIVTGLMDLLSPIKRLVAVLFDKEIGRASCRERVS
jgi:long-chain acyl-CoA synthetase